MNYLLQAIITKISGSALFNDVGGRVYCGKAQQGAEFPYIVFFSVGGYIERTFTERYSEYQIQFSLFSASESLVEISTMHKDLISLFDECSMSITGSTLQWMRQVGEPQQMVDEITTPTGEAAIHHWAQDFNVRTSLN